MSTRYVMLFTLACWIFAPAAPPRAEKLGYYLPDVAYDPAVPTPQEVLGFEVGQRHVEHHQLAAYMRVLAETSPRVAVREIGRSHGGRPLQLLTITSPRNHARLEQIRRQHRKLTDRQPLEDDALESLPAVINMGHSVHGDESSGSNAALLVGYYLAAAQDQQAQDFLDQLVILFDPCLNPDGLDRFAHWANALRGRRLNDAPYHAEHNQPWPGGRVNYYWFDLNRDWLPAQHPESQARLREYQRWKPNVVLDFHEMGSSSTFFFQPGVAARANPLIPRKNIELTERFAAFHSRALDQLGSLYFTEERFDDFYFGKGSTYPDIHGGVGILFEQASSRGHVQRTEQGRLTFPFTIRNQVTVSFTSLQATAALRRELLEYQRDFYQENWRAPATEGEPAVVQHVFSTEDDASRLASFAALLQRHDIEFSWLNRDLEWEGRKYRGGHALVAPASQRERRLLEAMLQQQIGFRENVFYDVSAWSLQLAFNLRHDRLTAAIDPELLQPQRPAAANWAPQEDAVAYVLDWRCSDAPRFAYRLLESGVDIRVAMDEFSALTPDGPLAFPRGSLVIPLGVQRPKSAAIGRILQAASAAQAPVATILSGLTPQGPDLGSSQFERLRPPRAAMPIGDSVSRYQAGEIWHLLDTRYSLPLSLVHDAGLGGVDWNELSVLILPSGSYRDVSASSSARIAEWVSDGGTVVAVGDASEWIKRAEIAAPEIRSGARIPRDRVLPYGDAAQHRALDLISGAIFSTEVDTTHPLGFGLTERLPVFRDSRIMLAISDDPYNNPVRYGKSPLLSGYCSRENQQALEGTASVQVHRRGRGRVILLADNPNFRAFWYGTNRLFANAIFFGPLIR